MIVQLVWEGGYAECGQIPEGKVTKASIFGSDLTRIGESILETMRDSMGRDRVKLPLITPDQDLQPKHANKIMDSIHEHLSMAVDMVPSEDTDTLEGLMQDSEESGIATFEKRPRELILEGMRTGLYMPWKLAFCSGVPTYADLLEQLSCSDSGGGIPPILGPLVRLAYGANGSLGSYSSDPVIECESEGVVFLNQAKVRSRKECPNPREYSFTFKDGTIRVPMEVREFNRSGIALKNVKLDEMAVAGEISGCPVRKGFNGGRSLIEMCVEFDSAVLEASLSRRITRVNMKSL